MAHYDRRFLVPYLHNVVTAEFLYAKFNREISACNARIEKLNSYINRKVQDPPMPFYEDYAPKKFDQFFDNIATYFLIFVAIVIGLSLMKWIFLLGLIPLIGAFAGIGFLVSSAKDAEKKAERDFAHALSEYNATMEKNRAWRQSLSMYYGSLEKEQRTLAILKRRRSDAKTLRDKVYSVNIIASTYRDIHAAYYLYQYFSTSRETDLDKIIHTMLLDQIKQQLATIIVQNEQFLLNQRVQIALQERRNSDAAAFQRRELQMLAQMERNQQLQLDYQNMLAQNQCVTNFLLTADYLHNIR